MDFGCVCRAAEIKTLNNCHDFCCCRWSVIVWKSQNFLVITRDDIHKAATLRQGSVTVGYSWLKEKGTRCLSRYTLQRETSARTFVYTVGDIFYIKYSTRSCIYKLISFSSSFFFCFVICLCCHLLTIIYEIIVFLSELRYLTILAFIFFAYKPQSFRKPPYWG